MTASDGNQHCADTGALSTGQDQLPPWPEVEPFESHETESRKFSTYHRARADAAMARLRIAVKALEGCTGGWGGLADKALREIGELP